MERIHIIDAKTETTDPAVTPDPLPSPSLSPSPSPTPIEVRGRYFLGQEDRNFRNTMYGIGDYLFIDGTRRAIKIFDAAKRMVVETNFWLCMCIITLEEFIKYISIDDGFHELKVKFDHLLDELIRIFMDEIDNELF